MKSKPIYRPLFLEAWKITWQHKRLWLLGIFATAMVSGGLFESLNGSWQTALKGRMLIEQLINGTIPGYQWLVTYSRYLAAMAPTQQYVLSTVLFLLIVMVVVIGVLAQGAILAGALDKKPLNFRELIKNGQHFFWQILWLDIIGKIGIGLVFLITVAPVAFLNPLPYGWHKYPPFVSLVLFLAGAIFVTVILMLSLVGAVRKQLNVRGALAEAWYVFRFHVWVSLELGIILFVTSLLVAVAALVALFILAIPLTLIFVLAAITASPTLYALSIFISAILIIATVLLFSGLLTTFQYTVWSLFFEEAGRFGIIAKVTRLFGSRK